MIFEDFNDFRKKLTNYLRRTKKKRERKGCMNFPLIISSKRVSVQMDHSHHWVDKNHR